MKKTHKSSSGIVQWYLIVVGMFAVLIGLSLGAGWLAGVLSAPRWCGALLGIVLAYPAVLLCHAVLYFFVWLFIIRKQPWNK